MMRFTAERTGPWQADCFDHLASNAQHRPEQDHRLISGHPIVQLNGNSKSHAWLPGQFKHLGIRKGIPIGPTDDQLSAKESDKYPLGPTSGCVVADLECVQTHTPAVPR